MNLGLRGQTLQSVLIEYTVTLRLSGNHVIVIESPYSLDISGHSNSLSPEDESEVVRQAWNQLIGNMIEEATADAAGALQVTFTGNARLTVRADAEYEAWTVSGPNGALVVSTAGGDLSVWKGQHSEGVSRMLDGCRDLIRSFVDGGVSADEFEARYLKQFKDDPNQVTGDEFDILDGLFADADNYVSDPKLRKRANGISGEELRARARDAYARIFDE